MTTALASPTTTGRHPTPARVSFGTLVKAEWISISSLRGMRASWIIGTLLVILPAIAFALIYGIDFDGSAEMAQWIPSASTLATRGSIFAVAVAVLIGAAAFAKEHSTGSLRTQLSASPRRLGMLTAKTLILSVATFVAAVVAFALAVLSVWGVYTMFGVPTAVDSLLYQVVLPVLGGALFAACAAVFALGVAAMLRSETWAVTLALLFIFLVPSILYSLPWSWGPQVADLLLGTTGQLIGAPQSGFTGDYMIDIALTIAWGAVAFFGGAAALKNRDA